MRLALGLSLGSQRAGALGPVITGTSPALAQTIAGDDLSDFVTWGSATAPDGETLTGGSPAREMNINGAGWVSYVGATALVDLETVRVRETWSVIGDTVPARTFQSVLRTTVREIAVNTVDPVASGSLGFADTLSVANGTWTGAVGGDYSYQWQRGGADIDGETASSYDITLADSAAEITCDVIYTNSGGPSLVATSNAVTVQTFTAPELTTNPTISGTARVGATLTVSSGTITGNPAPATTYQLVDSVLGNIDFAVFPTYVIQPENLGHTITVIQTVTTTGLGSDSATSAPTATIVENTFSVTLADDGTLAITGNDGRDFDVDDILDLYDGTYDVPEAALEAGPVELLPARLRPLRTAFAAETLEIIPALWAYDADIGPVTISYTVTNGTNAVDTSDPDFPTLLLDAADAGETITVTSVATQDAVPETGTASNGIAVDAAAWSAPTVVADDGEVEITVGTGQPSAPAAPTVVAGDGEATITQG